MCVYIYISIQVKEKWLGKDVGCLFFRLFYRSPGSIHNGRHQDGSNKILWIVVIRWKHLEHLHGFNRPGWVCLSSRLSLIGSKPPVSLIDWFLTITLKCPATFHTEYLWHHNGTLTRKDLCGFLDRSDAEIREDVWLNPSLFSSSSSIRRTSTCWLMQQESIESPTDGGVQIHRPAALFDPRRVVFIPQISSNTCVLRVYLSHCAM